MTNSSTKTILVMAFAFAFLMTFQGMKAYHILAEKAQAQASVTESVYRWKQNYMALGKTVSRWEREYHSQSSVQDMMALLAVADFDRYSLTINTDAVNINKIQPVTQNEMQIGLASVCLSSSGGGNSSALSVQAEDYQALFAGIKLLAKRPDISIGTISIKGNMAVPQADLGDFCILLRQ